jgi:hypothetical protein
MPFSFLNPWFWLGALAVAAPIWLHLRRRKETNLIHFSAVRFLEDQPQPRRSPLRISRLFLLALRILALLLVVGAFAWPYLRGTNTVPIRESRVYILDNTLSHQANDAFFRDRDQVLRELGQAGTDLQVAVVELASVPLVLSAFGDDRQVARQRLEGLRPSFQRGSYLAAFRSANSILENSLGEKRRIIFLGDNQANQWSENVNTPPFLRDVHIDMPKVTTVAFPNLWLSEPRAQRIFLGDKSLVNVTVKLGHTGEARSANITLHSSGQSVMNRNVDLSKQPESITLQAQWEADPGSWLQGEATVQGAPDALPADNRVFFSLPPVIEGNITLLARSPYVRLALSPEIMRGRWVTHILDPTQLGGELAAGQDADVLCLESNHLQSSEARKLLWRYLTNGRGVLLLVNRVTPAIDGCLRELGFESDGTVRAERDKPEKFQFVFSNHPIFHPFLIPDYGNLMDIKIWQYARLRPTAATTLIFSESGAGLFFQVTKFPGKLFVAAFGLEREQSSWPIHQTFIPFLDLALQAARSEDSSPTSFEPGEIGSIQFAAGSRAREAVLNENGREIERSRIEQGKAQLRMPDKPGLYSVTCDEGQQVEKMLTVNPSPKESQLRFINSPETIGAWRFNDPLGPAQSSFRQATAQIRLPGILQQRLWWWMVLGGLLALMLEMALTETRKETR